MSTLNNSLSFGKHYILTSIMNNSRDDRFFNQLDSLLVKKRFDYTAELSLTENLLHISTYKLTSKNILKIVNDFIKSAKKSNFHEKRNLFEIVKLSNLPKDKLTKTISPELYSNLIELLGNVSHETNFLSVDFLILKITDNFILKNDNEKIKEHYIQLKNDILQKITYYNYNEEKNEKETTAMCWIDRILCAIINEEITPDDFISVIKKIFKTAPLSIYLKWKALHAVNYILLQSEFSTSSVLKTFKRYILTLIEAQYENITLTLDEVKDLLVTTLAKRTPSKEDFYYLFDVIKIIAKNNEDSRLYCLTLCKYIINHNSKQNIFCFRFIRKYFIDMLFDIINKPKENIKIKEEELEILITLFHVDTFFCFYRHDIFDKIVEILQTINNGKTKLNTVNFYRYCDVLDYMMSENDDIKNKDIIKILSVRNDDETKIRKYFTLSFAS